MGNLEPSPLVALLYLTCLCIVLIGVAVGLLYVLWKVLRPFPYQSGADRTISIGITLVVISLAVVTMMGKWEKVGVIFYATGILIGRLFTGGL